MPEDIKTERVKPFYRSLTIEEKTRAIDEEKRTVTLSFSSELPVQRYFGLEILDHSEDSVDLSRLNNGGAVLEDHWSRQIGVVEKAWLNKEERRLYATLRFSRNKEGDEVFRDIVDGIRRNVSFGYQIRERKLESEKDGIETYRVTDWMPYEISIVSVPADPTVGVGRSMDHVPENECRIIMNRSYNSNQTNTGDKTMNEEDIKKIVNEAIKSAVKSLGEKSDGDNKQDNKKNENPDVIITAERNRINEIRALGNTFQLAKEADEAIEKGMSVDGFRQLVTDKLKERQIQLSQARAEQNLGLSDREARKFSFIRAIRALANPTDKQAIEAASFEFEVSRAYAEKRGKEPGGIFVPPEVLKQREQRDFNLSTGGGSNLRETSLMAGSFIEKLENSMVVMSLNPIVLRDLVGNIAIPRQTGGTTAYWIDPESSGITSESNPTVDQVQLSPKTIGAYTDISRRLLIQSSIDVEAFVRSDLALRLALGIDLAALNGSGASNQPTGILNQTGVGAITWATADTPTWGEIVDIEREVEIDNALVSDCVYVMGASIKATLKTTPKVSGQPVYIMPEANSLNGYRAAITNQMPASTILFGNFRDLILGFWSGIDLQVDTVTGGLSGTIRVIVLQDVDINVRHPQSFAKGTNA